DSTEYISFEPKIPGRFRWERPDELVFSPARPLTPATTFKATLKSDILQYSKYGKIGKADNIVFSTPSLQLGNINVMWIQPEEHASAPLPQVELYFNYPVNPKTIKDKMKLSMNGQPLDYSLLTLSNDDKITLRLLGIKGEDKDHEAKISLEKGLVPEGGTNATKDVIENKIFIPSPYNLSIEDVHADHNGESGTVYVHTSQQVLPDNIASSIHFSPAVKFSVETTDDGFQISSDNFDIDKSYVLTISKGLHGRIGGVLHEEYNNNIAFGELEPSLSFGNSKAVYLSSKGNQNIEVKITNIPKVKVIISKIYENNILTAQRYGYEPIDKRSRSTESDDDEGDYYDRYSYYENENSDVSMGDIIYQKEIDTRTLPKYGNSRLFTFNIEDRLPDFKGIYHIKIRSATKYWLSDSRFISKSDIGLIAKEGKDKIYVFANSIKTTEPVSGVNVTVYGNNNQVLGMAPTNQDGVAEVTCARKEFAGFKPAM
ncbi:MAG TPA: hypothetical protein VFV08_02845, partial [Puia sp.]|nr:hypothetical protein [Puia sp.]